MYFKIPNRRIEIQWRDWSLGIGKKKSIAGIYRKMKLINLGHESERDLLSLVADSLNNKNCL